MNARTPENKELEELLGQLCSGTMTVQQEQRLNQLLLASPAARQYYSDYLDVHLSLVEYAQRRSVSETADADKRMLEEMMTAEKNLSERVRRPTRLEKHPSHKGRGPWNVPYSIYFLVAGLAAGLLVFASVTGFGFKSTDTSTADLSGVESKELPPLYVAQVTMVTDEVVWSKNSRPPEFLLRVERGDRIEIDAGLVQLDFYGGATLILHGPCAFVTIGDDSGRLESGTITGNVSMGDFLLTTPTASVIDLGTEFGVSVDSTKATSVCVFDGKVEVKSGLAGGANVPTVLLAEGMTAEVDREGSIRQTSRLGEAETEKFVRKLPGLSIKNENEISLVDLFSAKTVSQMRLAGVIAPDTGEPDRNPWLREDGPGHRISNGYQKTDWHPYVDGVFVPNRTGEYTQLDSAFHTFDLPHTSGRTWGPIWSRRKFATTESSIAYEDYWGTMTLEGVIQRIMQCETGMMGLHANVGVTFDLRELRMQDYWPKKFRTTVQNLDNSLFKNPEWAKDKRFDADFLVFVDGELRDSRLDFTRADGEAMIEIELADRDRFLTLVSTDSGGENKFTDGFDHVVLVDPVLELETN